MIQGVVVVIARLNVIKALQDLKVMNIMNEKNYTYTFITHSHRVMTLLLYAHITLKLNKNVKGKNIIALKYSTFFKSFQHFIHQS